MVDFDKWTYFERFSMSKNFSSFILFVFFFYSFMPVRVRKNINKKNSKTKFQVRKMGPKVKIF
jgi:hypothetical protein